eukprot:849133-Rhodomonas_salina.1
MRQCARRWRWRRRRGADEVLPRARGEGGGRAQRRGGGGGGGGGGGLLLDRPQVEELGVA